jgi:hypothetical protein
MVISNPKDLIACCFLGMVWSSIKMSTCVYINTTAGLKMSKSIWLKINTGYEHVETDRLLFQKLFKTDLLEFQSR